MLSALLISLLASAAGDDKALVEEMHKHTDQSRECYNLYLDEGTGKKGVIVLKWKLNDDGKAVDVEVDRKKSTIKSQTAETCLLDLVKSITFTEPKEGEPKTKSYRFNFQ